MDRAIAASTATRIGWLSQTPPEFQTRLLAQCDLLKFEPGAAVYNAGDEPSGLFGVVDGAIKLYLMAPNGEDGLGHLGGPGFWTGDLAALTGRPRRLSITAAVRCWLLRLSRANLLKMTEADPGAWRHVASLIAGNLALSLDAIDALKRDDPVERIAATIVNLSSNPKVESGIIHISQFDLAVIARMSRNAANQAIHTLHRRGMILPGYGSIEVVNAAALLAVVRGE